MIFRKVRKPRLALLLFAALLVLSISLFDHWSEITDIPSEYRSHLSSIDYENYAASKGTTIFEIQQEFWQENQSDCGKLVVDDRGVPRLTSRCVYSVPYGALPAIRPTYTNSERISALWRTIEGLNKFLRLLILTAVLSITIVFVLPVLIAKTLSWLTADE